MKKIILIPAFMCLMLLSLGFLSVSAETYNDLTYTIENGEITITDYNGSDEVFEIPNEINGFPVKHIGAEAFRNCTTLESIKIPEGIVSIGDSAFYDCEDLSSIEIPDSVVHIGSSAFSETYKYKFGKWENYNMLYIGNHLVAVDRSELKGSCEIKDGTICVADSCFRFCDYITAVSIPNSVISIGEGAFYDCEALEAISIPDSVVSINNDTFSGCTALASVSLPKNLISIGEEAFSDCTALSTITIPDSVQTIGEKAFYNCTSLEKVNIDDIASWCNIDFSDDYANPIKYSNNIYHNNELIIDLVIPNGVTNIKNRAFSNCSTLLSVSIPNSVEIIDDNAFSKCGNLLQITIPDSVQTIGEKAFYNCTSLEKVNIDDIASWCNIDFSDDYANPIKYSNNIYHNDELVIDLVIPDGVTNIKNRAFSNCSTLVSISFPESIRTIEDRSFSDCSSLLSITIPNGVTIIESSVFSGCSSLEDIKIPNSITTIEGAAFSGCSSLKNISIPKSVTQIGAGSFSGCSSLEEITLPFIGSKRINSGEPNSSFGYIFGYTTYDRGSAGYSYKYNLPSSLKRVTITDSDAINKNAFYDLWYDSYDNIEEIVVLDGTNTIKDNAFRGCNALKNITLPETLVEIGSYVFSGCKIENIILPNSVELIGVGAFSGCSSLKSVAFSNKLASISGSMFSNCSGLESITIPKNIATIGQEAFYNCDALKNITLVDGVTTIQTKAFWDCDGLKKITIPASVQTIGVSVFESCSSLEDLTIPFVGSERGNSGTIDSVLGYIFGYVTSYSDKTTADTQQNYSSSSYAYYHIPASLKKVTVTDETFIGYGAFYGCTNISDIIIESDVKGIGSRAFAYHYNLLNVTIKSNSAKFADSMVFYDTDFATLYGYEGSTVEEYASKNGIDFEPIKQVSNYEISGYLKAINNTIFISVELSDTVTDECLHIALYSEKGQLVDYIIVPSYKPFNEMNIVFKDDSKSTYAKVFLWNSFTSMQPLAEAKEIDIIR